MDIYTPLYTTRSLYNRVQDYYWSHRTTCDSAIYLTTMVAFYALMVSIA